MARYEITGPDGARYKINAPDNATPDQVMAFVKQNAGSQPAAAPKKDGPGVIASGLEGVGQGLSFGFLDEIEGGIRAGAAKLTGDSRPLGEVYDEKVAIPRGRIAAAKESSPVAYYAGEIGSGVAVPGGLARLGIRGALSNASGRGLGARTLAGAKEGSAYGAAYGAGTAEGGLIERGQGALSGGTLGAGIGALAPGAVDAAGAVASRVAAPFRAAANPRQFAFEKFGEAIARDVPVGGADRFASRVDDMVAANPSARVMDAGGENVRGLMRAANNMPNEARETLRRTVDARQANQSERVEGHLGKAFRQGDKNLYDSIDELAERMDEIGAKAIQPALAKETPLTPQLASVLERPTAKELQKLVERKLADEGLPIGFDTRTAMLHRLKVELDDQIGMSVRAEKMGNRPQAGMDTRTLTILKRDLLNAIDNPTYKNGLKQYASQARLKNAAEDGYDSFNKMQPEELGSALGKLSNNVERDFFRLGAMRAIVERVRKGNANNDRTDGVFSSPEMQKKLKAVLPDEKARREFQKDLTIEAKMADSRKALQGNSTTAKQLAEGDQAGKNASMITQAMNAAGGSLQSGLNLLAQGYNRFSGMTPRVSAEVLKLGMSRDPSAIAGLVRQGAERAALVPGKRALRSEQSTSGLLSLFSPEPVPADYGLYGVVRPR